MAMDDFTSLFSHQENLEELKQKILFMTYELQSVRMQAEVEARNNRESIKNLLQLLQAAYKERDEAKNELHKLTLNSTVPAPESPLLINNNQGRTNSGVTESNSFSDTTANYNTSQGDSLYDVISPVISRSTDTGKITDPETQIIYNLAKGKTLPHKGKLLQSVMEAGPLLQTLMVAGPLPRWRNPPPLRLSQVPPVGFDGHNNQSEIEIDSGAHLLKRPLNSLSSGYTKPTCGSSEFLTSSVLNFAASSGVSNTRGLVSLSPSAVGYGCQMISPPKRQRIQ